MADEKKKNAAKKMNKLSKTEAQVELEKLAAAGHYLSTHYATLKKYIDNEAK
jgi:hypothetical protein